MGAFLLVIAAALGIAGIVYIMEYLTQPKKPSPQPVDLTGVYEDELLVGLRIKKEYDKIESYPFTLEFTGEDNFQFSCDLNPWSEEEFAIKNVVKAAIRAYRKHLMRFAALDKLVEDQLKEV